MTTGSAFILRRCCVFFSSASDCCSCRPSVGLRLRPSPSPSVSLSAATEPEDRSARQTSRCERAATPQSCLPLTTVAALSSCGSVLESVSFECWVRDVSLPVGESTLSSPRAQLAAEPSGPSSATPAVGFGSRPLLLRAAAAAWPRSPRCWNAAGDMGKSSSVLLTSRYRLGVAVSAALGGVTVAWSLPRESDGVAGCGPELSADECEAQGDGLLGPPPPAGSLGPAVSCCCRVSLSCCCSTRMVLCMPSTSSSSWMMNSSLYFFCRASSASSWAMRPWDSWRPSSWFSWISMRHLAISFLPVWLQGRQVSHHTVNQQTRRVQGFTLHLRKNKLMAGSTMDVRNWAALGLLDLA
ncbi:hypothetical protein CRUP_014666 [Coryphaenoides rupestris]|nr:hypothetical protein CRUP_014666 [Coryphaenoides rupestris]